MPEGEARPLDPRWLPIIDEVATRTLGRDDRRGEALAAEVRALSARYNHERAGLGGGTSSPAARLRFYLPRDLPKIEGPLAELSAMGALPRRSRWRVLDVGAGLGTTSLGVSGFAARLGVEALDVVALERDGAMLDVFARLAEAGHAGGLIPPIAIEARAVDLERSAALSLLPESDLIVVGLSLNELFIERDDPLEARASLLKALHRRLAPDGVLIVLEPALRETARALQTLRDGFASSAQGQARVIAPCPHDAPCPLLRRERDWCHDQLPFELPPALAELAEASGLRGERLTYSYLCLGHGPKLEDAFPDVRRVVGGPVWSKGKREWSLCAPEGLVGLRQLDREVSEPDRTAGLGRGSLVRLPPTRGDALRLKPDVPLERLRR